jgi:CBS domain-containing protein
MAREELLGICRRAIVQYRAAGEVIFQQGAPPGKYIFVVREGAVHLFREEREGERRLVEKCDAGDVFGIRPMLAERPYALTAEAVEETLLYAVSIEALSPVLRDNPKVAYYLASSFAADAPRGKSRLFLTADHLEAELPVLLEIQSIEYSKRPVTCRAGESIQTAARLMTERDVGSIIVVDEKNCPIGIVTDKDLRRQAATGRVALSEPTSAIMSSPVITLPPQLTVADVQIAMVKNRIHHLCITEDGADRTPVIGVISEHDLLVLQGYNPAVLIRETRRCKDGGQLRLIREKAEVLLRRYIYQEVSIAFISTVMTEVNDAIIVRAVQLAQAALAEEGLGAPPVRFCWLALGSEGRGEQLLRTDQDNALLFEDVAAERYPFVKQYFLDLAKRVNDILNEVGFEYCPADMMAGNPQWCISLSEWKRQFTRWIDEPTPKAVMFCTIFFDYRPVFGDAALARDLTEHIFDQISEQSIFLSFLARDAQQNPPPLTFFRNFVVEKSGEHQHAFDIKLRAMMPLADAARVLVLYSKISGINNTFRRFEKMAELEPQNRELYEQAAEAYEILMRYRTLQGLKHGDSGRYFDPSELSKMERMNLRNSFRPITELQTLLRVRFKLSFMT